jgi:hypothetical protein
MAFLPATLWHGRSFWVLVGSRRGAKRDASPTLKPWAGRHASREFWIDGCRVRNGGRMTAPLSNTAETFGLEDPAYLFAGENPELRHE